jgi:hypothetical protein
VNGIVIVKAGKQQLQQVFADLTDSPFGWQVVRIAIVQTADSLIRRQQFRDILMQ